ncbi:MAG: hypothetical protein WCD76_04825 [Pyrinomonadaceae bacterium]
MKAPSRRTVKRLFALSGNKCAFPVCVAPLADPASGTLIGEMCHIEAQSPKGPRYNPHLSEEELHAFENLILLCPAHHKVIDSDPSSYPVQRLISMKAEHERAHANGREPSDELADALRASASSTPATADHAPKLIELRRPPDSVVETLKGAELRRISRKARRYGLAAALNFLVFCLDLLFVSVVGRNPSSMLDLLPSPAFLLLAGGFGYFWWVELQLRARLKRELPFGGCARHLVREVTLGADYDRVASKCGEELRATGGMIYEIVRSDDPCQVTIRALKEHGGVRSRFTSQAFSLDEIEVCVIRGEGGECRIMVETSLGRDAGRSIAYTAKLLKRLLGWVQT